MARERREDTGDDRSDRYVNRSDDDDAARDEMMMMMMAARSSVQAASAHSFQLVGMSSHTPEAAAPGLPKPCDFPFYRGSWIPPCAPPGFYIPCSATCTEYDFSCIRIHGIDLFLPDGLLRLEFAGPPGLSPVIAAELSWGPGLWCPCVRYTCMTRSSPYLIAL